MRSTMRWLSIVTVAIALWGGTLSPAAAAHNGNNRAAFDQVGVSGYAVVNFVKGQEAFNGTVSASGLVPNATYVFQVSGAASGAGITVCTSVANSQGTFTCNFQKMPLPGFSTAEIEDSSGMVVASAVFERGGNCRDPQQAGSLCTHKH